MKAFACAALLSLAATALGEDKEKDKAGARPPFEKLLQWNGPQVFGGKVAVSGDTFMVTFDGPNQMTRAFDGVGILDAESPGMQGGNKKFIMKGKEVHPNLACAGIAQPNGVPTTWTSHFPVAGETKVSFDFRLPGLVTTASGFFLRLNVDGKNYLQTDFFRTAEKSAGGKTVKRETRVKEYAAHPSKWFPRNKPEGVPVELSVQGDRFVVKLGGKELASLDKVGDVSKGRIAIGFRKVVFTLQNLKVSGKIDRPWCEEQLAQLEKAGKLITKDPEALPPLPGEGDSGKKGEDAKKGL